MRASVFLVLCLSAAAPAYAQAPWEQQQPAAPGVPYVPGAPYAPGVPGVPTPYGYGSESWRLRQMEAERRAHNRNEERHRESQLEERQGAAHPATLAQTPSHQTASAALRGRGQAKSSANSTPANATSAGVAASSGGSSCASSPGQGAGACGKRGASK